MGNPSYGAGHHRGAGGGMVTRLSLAAVIVVVKRVVDKYEKYRVSKFA